jgi:protein-tyrosine phosphatase
VIKKILFICSKNKWRSLTAETIYKDHKEYSVKSAGTASTARVKINSKLITWADIIFVMERKHQEKLFQSFPVEVEMKQIVILEIEDKYKFMDVELIEEIKAGVDQYM